LLNVRLLLLVLEEVGDFCSWLLVVNHGIEPHSGSVTTAFSVTLLAKLALTIFLLQLYPVLDGPHVVPQVDAPCRLNA
jgi:hypothetical protein